MTKLHRFMSRFKPKRYITAYIMLGAFLLGSLGGLVYAAVPRPTGTIVVSTYDLTSGTRQLMGGVALRVNSLNYSLECADTTKTTNTLQGPNYGKATFTNCPAGSTITNRKYQKHVIISATKGGYQLHPRSPFKIGADKAASKGGSFAVRKKKKTFVRLYFVREGTRFTPPPPPPAGGGGGVGPSPNTNSPTPCGVAFVSPGRPLALSQVAAVIANPTGCHKKDLPYVS